MSFLKNIFWGKKKKNGERTKNGVILTDSDGVQKTLLTPAGKGAKYAQELKTGKRMTNSGAPKMDDNGQQQGLTKGQRAFRAGYIQARKDGAKAFKAKQKGGNK